MDRENEIADQTSPFLKYFVSLLELSTSPFLPSLIISATFFAIAIAIAIARAMKKTKQQISPREISKKKVSMKYGLLLYLISYTVSILDIIENYYFIKLLHY